MSTVSDLTVEQVSVLLWLKALYDFKEGDFETATFNEKFNAFEAVEDTGFSREEYNGYVNFWKRAGVIDENILTHKYSVSRKGQKLFRQLDEMRNSDDKEIADALEELLKATSLRAIQKYVSEHPELIVSIASLILQAIQLIKA